MPDTKEPFSLLSMNAERTNHPYRMLLEAGQEKVDIIARILLPLTDSSRVRNIDEILAAAFENMDKEGHDMTMVRAVIFVGALLKKMDPWPINSEEHAILCCCASDEHNLKRGADWLTEHTGKPTMKAAVLEDQSLFGILHLKELVETETVAWQDRQRHTSYRATED